MNVTSNTGLYDPQFEHDACGVGFVANIKGVRSHAIIEQGLQINENLKHRGACGCEKKPEMVRVSLFRFPTVFSAGYAVRGTSNFPKPAGMVLAWCFFPPIFHSAVP